MDATQTNGENPAEFEPMINPATGNPVVICIDADCPSCGWAERNFDTGSGLFGCSQCGYTSTDRNA